MTKHNFTVEDLTDDEMSSVSSNLEIVNDKLVLGWQKHGDTIPVEYRTALSSLYIIALRYEGIIDTLIVEIDNLKRPWWKKLFLK